MFLWHPRVDLYHSPKIKFYFLFRETGNFIFVPTLVYTYTHTSLILRYTRTISDYCIFPDYCTCYWSTLHSTLTPNSFFHIHIHTHTHTHYLSRWRAQQPHLDLSALLRITQAHLTLPHHVHRAQKHRAATKRWVFAPVHLERDHSRKIGAKLKFQHTHPAKVGFEFVRRLGPCHRFLLLSMGPCKWILDRVAKNHTMP